MAYPTQSSVVSIQVLFVAAPSPLLEGGLIFVGLSVLLLFHFRLPRADVICARWWRIWGTGVLVYAGASRYGSWVKVVLVLKFSGISALGKALSMHEQ